MTGERKDLIALLVGLPLFVFSVLYGLAVRIILSGYSSGLLPRKKLNVPVVSVGNLTMGGVGKTPLVILIAKMLRQRNLKTVILTRGYRPSGNQHVSAEADEVQMLREVLPDVPVVVNADRYAGGIEAIEQFHPDVIILDDGFQHWQLSRDLEIVVVDAAHPFGNGHLLPLGILREPVSSLKRADVIVLTKIDQGNGSELKNRLAQWASGIPVVESKHSPRSLTHVYSNQKIEINHLHTAVVAFSGIGDPKSFKTMLIALGADVKEFISFMDHHAYAQDDMNKIRRICDELGVRTVITTRKDAVKLQPFADVWRGYDLLVLNIEIDITQGENELNDRINSLSRR